MLLKPDVFHPILALLGCVGLPSHPAFPLPWLENLRGALRGGLVPPPLPDPPLLPHRPHGGLIFVRVCFNTAYGLHYTQTSHFHNYTMMGVPVKAIKQILLPRPVPPPPPALPIKLAGVSSLQGEPPSAVTLLTLRTLCFGSSQRRDRLSPSALAYRGRGCPDFGCVRNSVREPTVPKPHWESCGGQSAA